MKGNWKGIWVREERNNSISSKRNANEEKLNENYFLSIYILFLLYDLCSFHIRSVKWATDSLTLCNRRKRFVLLMTSETSSNAFKMFLLSNSANNKSRNNVLVTQCNNLVTLPETSTLWIVQLPCSFFACQGVNWTKFCYRCFFFATCFMCIPDQGQMRIVNVSHLHGNKLKNGLASA